jgi:hypothetical protein
MLVIIDDSQSRDEIGHTAHRLCLWGAKTYHW